MKDKPKCKALRILRKIDNLNGVSDSRLLNTYGLSPLDVTTFHNCGVDNAYRCPQTKCPNHEG